LKFKITLVLNKMSKKNNDEKHNDEIVQYILVNKELTLNNGKTGKMSPGKLGAQVGHVVCMVDNAIPLTECKTGKEYRIWYKNDMAKIVLGCGNDLMEKLESEERIHYASIEPETRIPYRCVKDLGRTEIKEGQITAIAFFPMYKSVALEMYPFLGSLKLY
jgi:peptidyl-tRNA hydrolase